jgi:hypothetical protein
MACTIEPVADTPQVHILVIQTPQTPIEDATIIEQYCQVTRGLSLARYIGSEPLSGIPSFLPRTSAPSLRSK